jgi:hypothetical protein
MQKSNFRETYINAVNISNRPIRLALARDNRIYKYLAQEVLLKYGKLEWL